MARMHGAFASSRRRAASQRAVKLEHRLGSAFLETISVNDATTRTRFASSPHAERERHIRSNRVSLEAPVFKLLKNVRSRLLSPAVTGFIAVLALTGTVAAVTSGDFTYSSTTTGQFSIHPMAMAPDSYIAKYSDEYADAKLSNIGDNCYSTGVNLPQGAKIIRLTVWYQSPATPNSNPHLYLRRVNLADGSSTALVSELFIVDDTDTRKSATLSIVGGSSVVNNTNFAYGFGICPGEGSGFFGARIAYTYTTQAIDRPKQNKGSAAPGGGVPKVAGAERGYGASG
jgi:hypothetical protein